MVSELLTRTSTLPKVLATVGSQTSEYRIQGGIVSLNRRPKDTPAPTLVGDHIFALNAGSNTLGMLAISASDPTQLAIVGETVAIPGEFPNTVAASVKNNLVCAGTTSAQTGISCSNFSENGFDPMDKLRLFELNQTTAPVGPTNTVSTTFVSADESILLTTVKCDQAINKACLLSAFSVEQMQAADGATVIAFAEADTRSTPEGTAVLFGSQVIPGTWNIFVTDAAFGAAILSVDPVTSEATTIAKVAVDCQIATWWVAISSPSDTAFVTDAGLN